MCGVLKMNVNIINLINGIRYVQKDKINGKEEYENDNFRVYFNFLDKKWYIENYSNEEKAVALLRSVDNNEPYVYGADIAEYLVNVMKEGGVINDNTLLAVLNNGFGKALGVVFKINALSILEIPEYAHVLSNSPIVITMNVKFLGKDKFTVFHYSRDSPISSPYEVILPEYLIKYFGEIGVRRDIIRSSILNEVMNL